MSRRTVPPTPVTHPGAAPRYRDRIWDDPRHDPYAPPGKYMEPMRCGECGAVYHRGRWQWLPTPERLHVATCPACRRTHDRLPAGLLTLEGPLLSKHRNEILRLVQHQAERERDDHPMHRIIDISERNQGVEVTTTDIHLPQRIGNAIKRAFHGELEISYGKDEYTARVRWRG